MSANAQIDIRGNMTRREINLSRRTSFPRKYAEPWDITIYTEMVGEDTVWKCSFANLYYSNDPVFITLLSVEPCELPTDSESALIFAKISTETATATVVVNDYDADIPEDSAFVKKPLYLLAKNGNTWAVACDLRTTPSLKVRI